MKIKIYSFRKDDTSNYYCILKYNIVTHETEVLGKVPSKDDAERIIEELNLYCPPVDISQ